jgi:hypothetical protein
MKTRVGIQEIVECIENNIDKKKLKSFGRK